MTSSSSKLWSSSSTVTESVTDETYWYTNKTFNITSNIRTDEEMDQEWINVLITIFAASIMIFIIVAAIFGNLLVIISVVRVRKLR